MKSIQQPRNLVLGAMAALFLTTTAWAGEVGSLTNFTAGTPAVAAEVNGNFSTVKTAVDDNNARVAALEAGIAALETRIAALEAKLASVSVVTHNGQPTVRFSGVNLQVVNGRNNTASANGTGNLIVGYDTARSDGTYFCSIGTYTNQTNCQNNGGTWAVSHKSGSHYLVVGEQNNYSHWGGIVAGFRSTSNNFYASVSGGYGNTASGSYASVSGGTYNTASGPTASVSGGADNVASGSKASVSGGYGNTASGINAGVSGGSYNTASGVSASVSGGGSIVVGGGNTASHDNSSILGGSNQSTSSSSQTIPALP